MRKSTIADANSCHYKTRINKIEFFDDFDDCLNKNWQEHLELDKKGNVKDTLDNLVSIIRRDKVLQGIAYDCHSESITHRGALPWKQLKTGWSDADDAALRGYLSKTYGLYSPNKTKDAMFAVAMERAFHPVKEFLDTLPAWDETERVETLFTQYLGAEDTSHTRAVTRKMLVAAVARVYEPGIKFNQIPIIVGPQGIGKSILLEKLGGAWFSNSFTITDMRDTCNAEKLRGCWIIELETFTNLRKADFERVKSFVNRTDDKYRTGYEMYVENHPRQWIIVGTTTKTGFLQAITGNRCFWPVQVTGLSEQNPWDLTESDVKQIWAEALILYRRGEALTL